MWKRLKQAATSGTSGTFSPAFFSKQLKFCQVAQRFGSDIWHEKPAKEKDLYLCEFIFIDIRWLHKYIFNWPGGGVRFLFVCLFVLNANSSKKPD